MPTFPIISGYIGYTSHGLGGSINSHGEVDRAVIAFTWPNRLNPIEFTMTNSPDHWGIKVGDGKIINCRNPVLLFSGTNNAIVQFQMDEIYPTNSPCILVYRSAEAWFNVKEVTQAPPFELNTVTGNFGFTSNGYDGSTDDHGQVNKVLFSIPYPARQNKIEFTISDFPTHWGARMGDGSIINLSNPEVLRSGQESTLVSFNMEVPYPANSPCLLVYRSAEAWYNIKEVEEAEQFKPVMRIDKIPTQINVGVVYNLFETIIIPLDATNQDLEWSIITPGTTGATIEMGTFLKATSPGIFTLRATIPGGLSPSQDYVDDIQITAIGSNIIIDQHPSVYTEVNYGSITEQLNVNARISPVGILKYQWYSNTNNSNVGGTLISGATNATFNIPSNLGVNENGQANYYYFCEIGGSDGAASIRSNVAVVNVRVRVTGIKINNKITNILALREHQFTTTITPLNSANKAVVWSSSDISIAVVTANGLFDAKKAGTVTITVKTYDGNYQDTNTITVAPFVPVSIINGIPNSVTAGNTLNLTGTVNPTNATNKSIIWSIKDDDGTGAIIAGGNVLQVPPYTSGNVKIIATIIEGLGENNNYIQNVEVTVTAMDIAVTDIVDVPTTIGVGGFVAGKVVPDNASNKTILWSMVSAGSTGATITSGGKIETGTSGIITVRGTVSLDGFYKDFVLNLTLFIPITDITLGIHNVIDINKDYALSGTVIPNNANNKTIVWSIVTSNTIIEETFPGSGIFVEVTVPVSNTANGTISNGNTLRTTSLGTTTVRASVINGLSDGSTYTKDFLFTAENAFVPVNNISLEESSFLACGIEYPLRLRTNVTPTNANNQSVIFEIIDAGGTGAELSNLTELCAYNPGTITLKCTVINGLTRTTNYVQNIQVQVDAIIPVTEIKNIPDIVYVRTDVNDNIYKFKLFPEIKPDNASFKTVKWFLINDNGTGIMLSESGEINNFQQYGTIEIIGIITMGAGIKPVGENSSYEQIFFINLSKYIYVNNIDPSFELIEYTGKSISLNNSIVEPNNAVEQDILWNIGYDNTGSSISNNVLEIGNIPGSLGIMGIINNGLGKDSNYIQNFDLKILKPIEDIISSFSLINRINNPLTLAGIIVPSSNSTVMQQIITWSIESDGSTNSILNNNILTATKAGTVKVRATIVNGLEKNINYTKDFNITIVVPVEDIISNFSSILEVNNPLTLNGTVSPSNATNKAIIWSISDDDDGSTNSILNSNILTATKAGTVKVIARIIKGLNGIDDYEKQFDFYAIISVTGISTNVPYHLEVNNPLTLNGTVSPSNATNKTIVWSISDDDDGSTNSTLVNNVLTAREVGTIEIMVTVVNGLGGGNDYTENFGIRIVQPISDVVFSYQNPMEVNTSVTLTGTAMPADIPRTIVWSISNDGGTNSTLVDNVLTPRAVGTVTVLATVIDGIKAGTNYTKEFQITAAINPYA